MSLRPAQVGLDMASMGGYEGMRRTAAQPGANAELGASNPAMNNQLLQNTQLAQQNQMVSAEENSFQAMAGQERQMSEGKRQADARAYKAQDLLNETKANILDANNAAATMMLFSNKGLTEKVTRDVAAQKAIGERLNPDLGDYAGQLSA